MDIDNLNSKQGMNHSSIFFKCEVQLLKKQIVSSYGFPLMQISEEKVNHFLKNLKYQKYEVKEQMIEAVACLIGETTIFKQKDDCFNIILERLKNILNNNGILFSFKSHRFNQRVAELFNRVYEMPNHQAIASELFRFDEFFLLLNQKSKETIQKYQLNTSSVVYESKSQKYMFYIQQMCDIEEYQYVRELRKYINTLLIQYEKFRSLQELINFTQEENSIEIINEKFKQIYEQTQTLKNSFQIIQSNNNNDGKEIDKIITSENQESSTTNTIEESKKQKKIEKLSHKQNFIIISDDEDDENQFKNTENLYKVDNDFIRQEIFGELKNKQWENIYQSISQKQTEYSKKLKLFKQLGLPSIKYNLQDFSKILSNYQYQTFPKQKQSLQIVISLIWESLNINKTQQPAQVVKKNLSNILHHFGINYQNQKQVIESLVAQSYQLIHQVENKLNVQQPFNYFKLDNLLNQPLPDFIFKLDNSKTEIAYKAKSMTFLKNFDKTHEIFNVRIIRKYLKNIQKILTALVSFPLQRNCDSHIKQTIIKQFTELENIYNKILSSPLNFSQNQSNPEQSISKMGIKILDEVNSNDLMTNEESICNKSPQNNHMEISQLFEETNSLGQSYKTVKLNSSTSKLGSQPETSVYL